MHATVSINPRILSWAIHRADTTVEELAKAIPKLPDWLTQKAEPTVKQLETFSKKVHLPFGYLFLPEPPKESLPFPYFRQGARMANSEVSLNVFDTILQVQQRQQWLSAYLKDEGGLPLPFIGKYGAATPVSAIVEDIGRTLQLPFGWATNCRTTEDALRLLTDKTEEAGVIVVINGIVGNSTRRRIDADECRGFVMVDDYAPFLFINNTDAEAAKMFTLVHELTHLWLGKSAGFDTNRMLPANDPVELLCDAVAAEFLVPQTAFEAAWLTQPDFALLARRFKVSQVVIARRALDLHKISKDQFFEWYAAWKGAWEQRKAAAGGGDFYNNQRNRVSLRFAALVERAVRTERITYRDAYRLTGLNGDTYHNFINAKLR